MQVSKVGAKANAAAAVFPKSDGKYAWPMVALFVLGAACFVFWPQISGYGVFIGESDRLNSYLNMRLAEYDALKNFGRIPDWDASMFGGFSLAALHWMNPGRDPVPYLLQYFSRNNIFWALGFIPILLTLTASLTSFLYIRVVTKTDWAALIGALAYGFSVFSLHRAAQVDNAELTVVLLPLGLLCLERTNRYTLAKPFFGLALVMTTLAFWGFLQEVAYTFLFFGVYALYRSALLAKHGIRSLIPPILVLAAASAVALIFSAPRLITIAQEIGLLDRTSTLHYYGYSQILRFFHDGIYGRYFDEGRLLGHGMNLSEGLQLTSSCALSLFVCFGVARPRTCMESVGAVLFYALLLVIVPTRLGHSLFGRPVHLSVEFYKFILFAVLLFILISSCIRYGWFRFFSALKQLVPLNPRPKDTTFHIFVLTGVLFLILILEGNDVVYYLFGRADFTHTRLSLLAILPLCTLFSIYLAELKSLPVFVRSKNGHIEFHVLLLTIILSAAAAYITYGPFLDWLLPYNTTKLVFFNTPMLPVAVAQLALTCALLGVLAFLVTRNTMRHTDSARVAGLAISVFVLGQIILYANLKMSGPQTWTYPVPFRGFNYFNVRPSILRPPEQNKLLAFDRLFEGDKYRMVVLSDNTQYVGVKIPHVAQFWRARSIGGYGTGVSARLTRLPWPHGVQSLRTIDFISTRGLDESAFTLLAFLNAKYLIVLTPEVYFNLPTPSGVTNADVREISIGGAMYPLQSRDVAGIRFNFLENPVSVLPRHFLAERVIGNTDTPTPLDRPYYGPSAADKSSFLHVFVNQTDDLRRQSYVEGFDANKITAFDASGQLDVTYSGDRIEVGIRPSDRARFLVINQTFNPKWKAFVGTKVLPVLPTNAVMSGILIPPHASRIELRFESFSSSRAASILMMAAGFGLVGGVFLLSRWQERRV